MPPNCAAGFAADPLLREKNISASFGIACYPLHGSSPQELIQVADASMYLSKHQGGNAVSTADHFDPNEAKKWKRDVLEAYLGVTLKRLFATGPEAFEEIYSATQAIYGFACRDRSAERIAALNSESPARNLPQAVLDTVTSLAFAIDAKDHYTQGHSQKVSAYAALIAEAMEMSEAEDRGNSSRRASSTTSARSAFPKRILEQKRPVESRRMGNHEVARYLWRQNSRTAHSAGAHSRDGSCTTTNFSTAPVIPMPLSGENIPLGARIIAVADAYDTITSDRTYKKGRTVPTALSELERCANAQFDGRIVEVFVRAMRQLPNPIIEVASLTQPQYLILPILYRSKITRSLASHLRSASLFS